MVRSFVYHLIWFVLVVFVVYSTIIYAVEMGLSYPVRFVVAGLLIVALAVTRQLADQALGRRREE